MSRMNLDGLTLSKLMGGRTKSLAMQRDDEARIGVTSPSPGGFQFKDADLETYDCKIFDVVRKGYILGPGGIVFAGGSTPYVVLPAIYKNRMNSASWELGWSKEPAAAWEFGSTADMSRPGYAIGLRVVFEVKHLAIFLYVGTGVAYD
ncbi:hypothetical protein B0H11DRAFT_1936832 [Mycena galericulata]|nr:hypothetical protein B0H11DRAFT_1936832 [Mycena galericulata]